MGEEASKSNYPPSIESQPSRPGSARWLNVALLAVGLIGWMIFVVACVGGPAWSPDGSKVLFGYYDEANSRAVVAVYDRKTHKTRDLFAQLIPQDDKDKEFVVAPAWQADGARALVAMTTSVGGDDPQCAVLSIPIGADGTVEAYNFGKDSMCYSTAWVPQIGGSLYLGGEHNLSWLNLATGQVDSKRVEDGTGFISERNGQLVYMREVDRPDSVAENTDAKESGIEFGQIELKGAILKPTFSIWGQQVIDLGLKDNMGGSWEPTGTRIAMVANGTDGGGIVLLDEKKGLLGQFTPDLGVKTNRMGPPVWSHDGKTLYAPVITNGDKEKAYVYALAEIPVAGTSGRLTRIADFQADSLSEDDESNMLTFGLQVALSPDGNTIAASTATLQKDVAANSRGLFLIDVQHSEHRITYIPAPRNSKAH